ncbi:hypothetical protein CBS101457_000184 [Exobasidium rhododendri]|nr:hypothetical protein CBS101457_000184 [Exobasidium rhododendri]
MEGGWDDLSFHLGRVNTGSRLSRRAGLSDSQTSRLDMEALQGYNQDGSYSLRGTRPFQGADEHRHRSRSFRQTDDHNQIVSTLQTHRQAAREDEGQQSGTGQQRRRYPKMRRPVESARLVHEHGSSHFAVPDVHPQSHGEYTQPYAGQQDYEGYQLHGTQGSYQAPMSMEQLNAAYSQNMSLGRSVRPFDLNQYGDGAIDLNQYSDGGIDLNRYDDGTIDLNQYGGDDNDLDGYADEGHADVHYDVGAGTSQTATPGEIMIRPRRRDRKEVKITLDPNGNQDILYNEIIAQGIAPPDDMLQQLISAPQPVFLPNEYTLRVHPHFPYTCDDEFVYKSLSDNQTLLIMDMIRQVRPYESVAIRKALGTRLTASLAKLFLSGNKELIEYAIETFYPRYINKKKGQMLHEAWMTGMNDTQRKTVVERFADETGEPTDRIRELFIKSNITQELAMELLNTRPGLLVITAAEKGLKTERDDRALPWQEGASKIQRAAFMQRMVGTGIKLRTARQLLQRRSVSSGYALHMLRLDDAEFKLRIGKLRGVNFE